MNSVTPRKLLPFLFLYFGLLGLVSAEYSTTKMTAMGDDTFAIVRTGTSAFHRDVDQLKSEAREDAAKYCAQQGKHLKVIAVTSDRPHFSLGYASARVVFKAVDRDVPEAKEAKTEAPAVLPELKLSPTLPDDSSGDFYTKLLKLDDLHKRGILTDKEFESMKKKIIKNAN